MTDVLTTRYEVHPASPVLGAEIIGVDLTQPVDQGTAQALRQDFWTYKVLVFRHQDVSPTQHVEAVRIFDEPFDHPSWLHRHPDSRRVTKPSCPSSWRTPPRPTTPSTSAGGRVTS